MGIDTDIDIDIAIERDRGIQWDFTVELYLYSTILRNIYLKPPLILMEINLIENFEEIFLRRSRSVYIYLYIYLHSLMVQSAAQTNELFDL